MKLFIPIFCLLAVSFGRYVDARSFDKSIVGGTNAQPGEAPFQVWVRQVVGNSLRACGGILYKSNKVLTAAHCAIPGDGDIFIRYGTQKYKDEVYPDVKVQSFKQHPDWNSKTIENDIAILTLSSNIKEDSRVKFAQLQTNNLKVNDKVTIYGWGKTSFFFSDLAEQLQKTTLTITSLEPKRIVAKSSNSIACSGDSGGVMVSADGKAAGIASAVSNFCPRGGDNFYTKISAFLPWINSN